MHTLKQISIPQLRAPWYAHPVQYCHPKCYSPSKVYLISSSNAQIQELPFGIIRLNVLRTSCIGRSFVPTFSFSNLSRSSRRIALSARTLFDTSSIVWHACSNL